jgi:hypothetical protein
MRGPPFVESYVTAYPPEVPLPDPPLARLGIFLWGLALEKAFLPGIARKILSCVGIGIRSAMHPSAGRFKRSDRRPPLYT